MVVVVGVGVVHSGASMIVEGNMVGGWGGWGGDEQQLLGSPILFVFFLTSLIEYRGLDTHTQYTIEQISVKVKKCRAWGVCVCVRE